MFGSLPSNALIISHPFLNNPRPPVPLSGFRVDSLEPAGITESDLIKKLYAQRILYKKYRRFKFKKQLDHNFS